MLERDSDKAKKSCIPWKRRQFRCRRFTGLTPGLSTETKRKKGMLQYCFSLFPDKNSHKIDEAVTPVMEGMGITIKASYNLKIY